MKFTGASANFKEMFGFTANNFKNKNLHFRTVQAFKPEMHKLLSFRTALGYNQESERQGVLH